MAKGIRRHDHKFLTLIVTFLVATVSTPRMAQSHDNAPIRFQAISSNSPLPAAAGGLWSEPEAWPVLAVHANLLPTGKVLAWDATPDDFDEDPHTTENYTTRVTLWDPVTHSHVQTNNNTDTDLFCAGSAHLWDGRVLFAGGDSEPNGRNGPLSNTNLYDPWTNTWERADNMSAARWYSSVTALPNGEMLTLGGSYSPQPLAEVFQLDQRWRDLHINPPYSLSGDYQWIQTGPDGSVLYFGPHNLLSTINTEDKGRWEVNSVRDEIGYRGYGSYAMYDQGKILVSGGGDSSASAVIVDATTKQVADTASMHFGRRQHNLTILADGSVLATGGNNSGSELIDLYSGVLTPEIWNPGTGQWQVVNDMQVDRQYHSTALLLPDARVLSAGGGYCGLCSQLAYHEQNAEVYSPPYLFDANSQPARRPAIVSAPKEANYGSRFALTLNSSNQISRAHLIKLGSTTHSENQDQRLIPLSFEQRGAQMSLIAPTNRNAAPPGHYMLFVLENNVPSHAHIIKIGQPLLQKDQLVRNRIRSGEQHVFAFEPQENTSSVSVTLGALESDLDLVARIGSPPDSSISDSALACESRTSGNANEFCSIELSGRETVYVGVVGTSTSSYNLQLSANLPSNSVMFERSEPSLQANQTLVRNQLIPTVPSNLRGVVYSANSAEIFWNASVDNQAVQRYDVLRNGELILSSDARSVFQTDLQPGTSYTYSVQAFDNEGNRSARSSSLTLQTSGRLAAAQIEDTVQPESPEPEPVPPEPELESTQPELASAAPEPAIPPMPAIPTAQDAIESQDLPVQTITHSDQTSAHSVVFRLIDANADVVINAYDNLGDGDRISLASLPSEQLNIEAFISDIVGISAVRFDFNGTIDFQTEQFAPYALFGNRREDFIAMPIGTGTHTVAARVFVANSEVASRTITFSIVR